MKTNIFKIIFVGGILCLVVGISLRARAEEDYCEVMTVKGAVTVIQDGASSTVRQGEHLKAGDKIQVGPNSYVDLAYDKAWKNVTRIRENSEVKLGSIQPTHLDMKQGDIFSRIKELQKDSTFEIQTPTAVAAVRGTKFRTIADAAGKTEILNQSELPGSQVFVFGLDAAGNKQEPPIALDPGAKTEISKAGKAPSPSQPFSAEDIANIENFTDIGQDIENKVQNAQNQSDASSSSSSGVSTSDVLSKDTSGGGPSPS